MKCPKCSSMSLLSTKLKNSCKDCNYEILIINKENCKYCSSSILVKYKEYYNFYIGKYQDDYICYVCGTEQFKRVEK